MHMQDTRISVQVAGQNVRLRGTDDEAYIRCVAAFVDERVETIQKANSVLSTSNCVVLAALNIADELFKLRQQYAELDKRIEELRRLTTGETEEAKRAPKGPVKRPFEEDRVTILHR